MSADPAESATGRSVVERVVALMEAFDDRHRCLTGSDLARRSGLPVATAHRLVQKMVALGVMERMDDGRYGVGPRLWSLGMLSRSHEVFLRGDRQALATLVNEFGAVVRVWQLMDRDMLCLQDIRPGSGVPGEMLGAIRHVSRSTVGSVLAADLSPGVRRQLAITGPHLARIESDLEELGRSGYLLRTTTDTTIVATEIAVQDRSALGLEAIAPSTVDVGRLVAATRQSAYRVSAALVALATREEKA